MNPTPNSSPVFSANDEQEAKNLLAAHFFIIPSLSPHLQRVYDKKYFARKVPYENYVLPIGLLIFLFYMVAELTVKPEYVELALILRILVVSCLLLGIFITRQFLSNHINEKLYSFFSISLPATLMVLMHLATSTGVILYNSGIMLTMLFINVVWQQRFLFALFTSVSVLFLAILNNLYIGIPEHLKDQEFVYYANMFDMNMVIMMSLVANYIINSNLKRSFLKDVLITCEQQHLYSATKKIEKASQVDGLTGLYNRKFFDAEFSSYFKRAVRNGSPISLLFIDVDYFKKYNDHFGHQQGDKCLTDVANVLQSETRQGEVACRYGGEEFVVIVSGDRYQSEQLIGRIQSALSEMEISHPKSEVNANLTLSIGVCTMVPTILSNEADLIRCADTALYNAKHSGRNRFCHWYEGLSLVSPIV